MHVYVYDNKGKDVGGKYLNELTKLLDAKNITYKVLSDDDLHGEGKADAIFVLGGDGTILWLVKFANKNKIPLIGINVGKLGFLSEFDSCEIETAVNTFSDNAFILDERMTLKITHNGNVYYSLNDAYVHRIYNYNSGCMTVDVQVSVGDRIAQRFKGDGVIVCSPTGSTAYSLSAGGPVVTPDVNAFCITPIAAHAFSQRAIVCNADAGCQICLTGKALANLFVDGKLIAEIHKDDVIKIEKAEKPTLFMRKKDFDFYKRLTEKLKFDCGR
jgi:NAD+ kinase